MTSRLLTKSRLSAARQCQRLHDIQYLQGYRPLEDAKPLSFGTLVHGGLESIWKGHGAAWAAGSFLLDTGADPFDLARARPMLRGYNARWAEDRDAYEVIAVEKEFDCPLVNPETGAESKTWRLAGKLDVLVRERSTRKIWVIEHKSSSADFETGSSYWARLRMDTQASIYFAGAQSLGYDVEGLIYDVLGKPGLRPGAVPVLDSDGVKQVVDASGQRVRTKDGKKWRETGDAAQGFVLVTRPETPAEFEARVTAAIAAKPEDYYQRGKVMRLDGEMVDAMTDIWQSGQQLREAERMGRSPRNPDACEKWGRLCDFFPVCSGAETLQNERLYRLSANVHPELSHGNETQATSRSGGMEQDSQPGANQAPRDSGSPT
jgi:hypothetical protein